MEENEQWNPTRTGIERTGVFNLFINGLELELSSLVTMFADYAKLFRIAKTKAKRFLLNCVSGQICCK